MAFYDSKFGKHHFSIIKSSIRIQVSLLKMQERLGGRAFWICRYIANHVYVSKGSWKRDSVLRNRIARMKRNGC